MRTSDRKRRVRTGWAAAALLVLVSAPAGAQVAITGKGGTLGVGAELTVRLAPQLNGRLGINGYNYSDRREASDIEYDAEANLRTATALLDWHPGGGGFRLSAGAVYNDTRIEGSSLPPASGSYIIGGVPVPVSLVGTLDAEADFDPVVPYVGLGWGNAVGQSGRVGFSLDIGAIFQGQADVTLIPVLPPDSPIHTTPGARELLDILLEREAQDLEEEVADYDVYPVVSIGVSYRF